MSRGLQFNLSKEFLSVVEPEKQSCAALHVCTFLDVYLELKIHARRHVCISSGQQTRQVWRMYLIFAIAWKIQIEA